MGLVAAHLYKRDADRAALLSSWGEARPNLSGELPRRLAISGSDGIDELPWFGATEAGPTALLTVDQQATLLMALFRTAEEIERFPSSLNSLDYAIQQHLRQREILDHYEQARAIQLSLLPPGRPAFEGFDIAAVSIPASAVGGDLYDFIPLDQTVLAVTVADASGHGLPAALQARDVAMGLRMGAERDFKIRRMIEKLNRIIHGSGVVSRFVSLIYGELDQRGSFSYVNCGHPPALLLDTNGFRQLAEGGLMLGPFHDAVYQLGFERLEPESSLAIFSDGVVERSGRDETLFGEERVRQWMIDWRDGPADRAISDLLARLRDFGQGEPFADDVTMMLIRRLG
jgi:sigma-B regulation protein RsbU (phosphoserine phosphatase)